MREQTIKPVLKELHSSCEDIESSVVISVDGLTIAAILPQEVDEDSVSAMGATLLAVGEQITAKLICGQLKQLVIGGTEGNIMIIPAGLEAILVVIVRKSRQIESIAIASKKAAQDISDLLAVEE